MFIGLALIAVAACQLVPAFLTGIFPSNWPVMRLSRIEKRERYRITFGVFVVTGAVGIGIFAAALARWAGL